MNKMIAYVKKNDLAALLLLSIFMNGFETGGYQAALLYVGQSYNLSTSGQGIMASVELFATMIAPMIFGSVADRIGKKIMLVLATAVRVLSAFLIMVASGSALFAIGIFVLGFATSIIQYVAIAGMDDAYPLTNHHRMGFIAAMYALGAVVAPVIVGMAVQSPMGWKTFFFADLIISLVMTILLARISFEPREEMPTSEGERPEQWIDGVKMTPSKNPVDDKVYVFGVGLLCFIMFIYVGVENGVGFFLNGYYYDVLDSEKGYMALSLFWFAMIPSRILCGIFAKYRKELICIAPTGATAFLLFLGMVQEEMSAFLVIFVLGFFCGAVYPNVLTYAADFAGKKTATVTAAITVATGIGGTVVSAAFGFLETAIGYRGSFVILAIIMALDIGVAFWVIRNAKKRSQS